ncbi:metalloendopeptidase OMA1, mitochondrial [Trichonephila clavipes]|nr:metalloendopeptidase OMA1, mitochondrial [Trichonephila clavipes]
MSDVKISYVYSAKTDTEKNSGAYENLGGQVLPANHPATKRVENVVNRILAANADIKELEGKKFRITVINTPAENAFVIPIGHVFVYAGMLNLCSNDDQLGIILSHEIAHCILNHGMENLSFTHLLDLCSLAIIAVIWAVIPSDTISVLSHWMFNKSIALFLQLPYNRTIETEADHVGLQLAAKACFDVRESSAFWSKMAYLSKKFGSGPEVEFLSTHPSHESRSEYLNNIMDDALVIWIEDLTQKRIPLDGHLIKMKALKFYKELKESEPSTSSRESNPQFSASTGWLTGFIKRHSFHNLKIKGEVASADEEAARKIS